MLITCIGDWQTSTFAGRMQSEVGQWAQLLPTWTLSAIVLVPSYPSTYDTEGLKKAIFLEREKEFIGENDARYADIIRNGYVKEELQGKFKVLTNQDIQNGALFLPLPKDAWQDKDGHVINNQLRQKPYWQAYN